MTKGGGKVPSDMYQQGHRNETLHITKLSCRILVAILEMKPEDMVGLTPKVI